MGFDIKKNLFTLSWLPWHRQPLRKCQTLNALIYTSQSFITIGTKKNFSIVGKHTNYLGPSKYTQSRQIAKISNLYVQLDT